MRLHQVFFFILAIVCTLRIEAQRPVWHNFNVHHGLTGNEVYDILPAKNGHIWFVADQGICRFNGYEFFRPVDTSAMRGTEAFLPTEDAAGRIWFARLDGSIWYIENDTIRTWKYNAVARPFLEKNNPIESIIIDKEGNLWLAIHGLGLLVVNEDGTYQISPSTNKSALVFANVGGKIIFTSHFERFHNASTVRIPVISQMVNNQFHLTCFFQHYIERGIWRLRNGDILISCQDSMYLIHQDRIKWQVPRDIRTAAVLETPDGGLYLASHSAIKPGLFYYESPEHLEKGKGVNLLPGYSVTDVQCDHEGGIWASTHHAGVLYCSNPGVAIFDQSVGLPSREVTCLDSDGISVIYAGLANGDLAEIDTQQDKVIILPRPPLISKEVQAIFYHKHEKRLWISQPLHYLEKDNWKPVHQAGLSRGVLAKSISASYNQNNLWTSAPNGFFNVEVKDYLGNQLGETESKQFLERTFSVVSDGDDNIWVSTSSGLRLWRNDTYEMPPWDHPALRHQARELAILPHGGMAISLPGTGLLIRDTFGHFTHLTQNQGLNSDFISKLYVSPEGYLFACSYHGLNIIKPKGEKGWKIECIDVRKGLPSNHVKDVIALQGALWVATDLGLAHLRKLPEPAPMSEPVLEKWLVNNKETSFTPDMDFSHDENNLRIRFYTLHFRSLGDIPYRYRLIGADTTFTYSQIREVHYAQLSPGAYTFEVQAQNEDGAWSESARWSFQIRPAWWDTFWFRGSMVILFLLGSGIWIRRHFQKVKREAQAREKILELEAAALRAQMNPHFIFNCLGSIQHFIAENDPASATRYLASFARLVRLALHGSVDGLLSIKEEIEMLENYLVLEQLRFRNKFSYTIQVDPDLDPDDISLPPLLVQPFVENAILHGMSHKENDGRISIHFFKKEGFLNIEVTDNGPGLAPDGLINVSDRKSVGMLLTERRLELLTGKSGVLPFQIANIRSPNGSVEGTRVVVRMPLGDMK